MVLPLMFEAAIVPRADLPEIENSVRNSNATYSNTPFYEAMHTAQ